MTIFPSATTVRCLKSTEVIKKKVIGLFNLQCLANSRETASIHVGPRDRLYRGILLAVRCESKKHAVLLSYLHTYLDEEAASLERQEM